MDEGTAYYRLNDAELSDVTTHVVNNEFNLICLLLDQFEDNGFFLLTFQFFEKICQFLNGVRRILDAIK